MAIDRMVKACFKCRVYIEIGNTYELMKKEQRFDQEHRGHPVQVVRISEVKEHYQLVE